VGPALFRGRGARVRRQLADLADLRAGQAVLDVGSGTGTLALALARVVGRSGTVTGVDPSPEMAAAARRKASRRRNPADFAVAAAQALPFPDGAYDAVVSTLVLHHVPPEVRATALTEMLRVLRPGGHLVIGDLQPATGVIDRALTAGRFRHGLDAGYLDDLTALAAQSGVVDVHRHPTAVSWLGVLHGRRPPG